MTIQEIAKEDIIVQFLSLFCVLLILISQIYQYYVLKDNNAKIWILLLTTGVIHNAVFYIVLNLDRYTTINITPLFGSYTIWSSIRILHLFATWAIVEGFRGWILFSRHGGFSFIKRWISWSKRHAK